MRRIRENPHYKPPRTELSPDERAELARLRAAYQRVCTTYQQALADLEAASKRLAPLEAARDQRTAARRRLDAELNGHEEEHRERAWVRAGAAFDETRGDYVIPPLVWPDGVDAEQFIAKELGLVVRDVIDADPPPASAVTTYLHAFAASLKDKP